MILAGSAVPFLLAAVVVFVAPDSMMRSPLTVGIIFVLAGYYACYYGRVLWKSKGLKAADLEDSPIATAP